jgi:hypothetical protein
LISFIFFYSLKKNDRLRVEFIYEIIGLDFLREQRDNSPHIGLIEEEVRWDVLRLQQYENQNK